MNKQTYRAAYHYIRCELYKNVTEAALDYPSFSPCSGCDMDCSKVEDCKHLHIENEMIEFQIAKWAKAELERLQAQLTTEQIETARQHYYTHKNYLHRAGGQLQIQANRLGLAYPQRVRKSNKLFVTRWNWHSYFYAQQEIERDSHAHYYTKQITRLKDRKSWNKNS